MISANPERMLKVRLPVVGVLYVNASYAEREGGRKGAREGNLSLSFKFRTHFHAI